LRKIVRRCSPAPVGAVSRGDPPWRGPGWIDAASSPCDLPVEVTDDFPLTNLADLLGVPLKHRSLLLAMDKSCDRVPGPDTRRPRDASGKPINRVHRRVGRHVRLCQRIADYKRKRPGDDLMNGPGQRVGRWAQVG